MCDWTPQICYVEIAGNSSFSPRFADLDSPFCQQGFCPAPGAHHLGTAAFQQIVVSNPRLACAPASSETLATAHAQDAERSVAMAFQKHISGTHTCLLALPSSDWDVTKNCPEVNPAALKSGRVPDSDWQLLHGNPRAR